MKTKDSNDLIKKVIKIYMEEDYNYAAKEILKGNQLELELTTDNEIEFINRNGLGFPNMTDIELRQAASQIVDKINEIHKEIQKTMGGIM